MTFGKKFFKDLKELFTTHSYAPPDVPPGTKWGVPVVEFKDRKYNAQVPPPTPKKQKGGNPGTSIWHPPKA